MAGEPTDCPCIPTDHLISINWYTVNELVPLTETQNTKPQCTFSDPIATAMAGLSEILAWDAGQIDPAYFPDLARRAISAKSPSSTSGAWPAVSDALLKPGMEPATYCSTVAQNSAYAEIWVRVELSCYNKLRGQQRATLDCSAHGWTWCGK